MKCMKCNKVGLEIGCEVKTLDMEHKGYICEPCTCKPAKLRKGLLSRGITAGKPKGWATLMREMMGVNDE